MKILKLVTLFFAGLLCLAPAKMVFESKLVEIEVKPGEDVVTASFPFKIESEDETIMKAEVFCTCLKPRVEPLNPDRSPKMTWKVGEEGVIKVRFETGKFIGTVDKAMKLVIKDRAEPEILTVRVKIPQLIKVTPQTVKWDTGGTADTQVITLKVDHEQPIKIVSHRGNNDSKFPYELKTIEEGREYQVTITPSDVNESGIGMISLRTDSKFPRFKRQVLYAVVRPKPPTTK